MCKIRKFFLDIIVNMKEILEQKIGHEYSTLIIDGNSSDIKKHLKTQLKSLSSKSISKKPKPFLIIFYFKIIQLSNFTKKRKRRRRKSNNNDHCLFDQVLG